MEFSVPLKLKENENRDKCLDFARELKKTMEHENDGDHNCNWRDQYSQEKDLYRNWKTWK